MNADTAFNIISKDGEYFTNKDGSTLYFYNNSNHGKTPMLFLHTLRTQAEFHHKILPYFIDDYDCYLVDWPGHGRSSKDPHLAYTAQYMVQQVIEFIQAKGLKDMIIVGESIGATGALSIASKIPERVKSVYVSNPFDAGLVIGKLVGKVVSWLGGKTPLLNKDEIKGITKYLIAGGFIDKSQLDDKFIDLISENAKQNVNFGAVFHSFLANQKSWHKVRENDYKRIPKNIRVNLLYSDEDWSAKWVRKENEISLGGALNVIKKAKLGHFSFLEQPNHIVTVIKESENMAN